MLFSRTGVWTNALGQVMGISGAEAVWAGTFLLATRTAGRRRYYTGVEDQATSRVGGLYQRATNKEGFLNTGVQT